MSQRPLTQDEYLEAHHSLAAAAFTRLNELLGHDDYPEAKAVLVAALVARDALWAARLAKAAQETNP